MLCRRQCMNATVARACSLARWARINPTLLLGVFITFFDTFTVGLVNPVYPQLVQGDVVGATAFAIILSSANAASLAASTAFGRLSDVHGRKVAIVACTVCTMCGYVCYAVGWCTTQPGARLLLPALGRVVSGMGRSALSGPIIALLSDNTHPTQKSGRIGRTVATFGLGYAFGSALGGLAVARGGASTNLILIVLCSMVQVACACLLPRTPLSTGTHPTKRCARHGNWRRALHTALAVPGISLLLTLQALAAASFSAYDATSALFVQSALGYTASQRGFLLAYAGWVFSLQSLVVVPRFVGSGQPLTLLCFAFSCTAIGRLGLASATCLPATPTIVLSYLVLNFGQAMTHTLLKSLTAHLVGKQRSGMMLGVLNSVDKACGILAPLVGGPAYDLIGPSAPACLSALFAFAAFGTAACSALDISTTSERSCTIQPVASTTIFTTVPREVSRSKRRSKSPPRSPLTGTRRKSAVTSAKGTRRKSAVTSANL